MFKSSLGDPNRAARVENYFFRVYNSSSTDFSVTLYLRMIRSGKNCNIKDTRLGIRSLGL